MPEQFIPRTEREYWQAIADALNAANRAGMPVGIDLDGTLTDHNAHSIVWNFEAERWDVAGYDEEQPADGAQRVEDPFTEAAIRRNALLNAADTIERLPQDFECDPGRGDAVKVLRRLAGHVATDEQPTGPDWQARASHASRLYATAAIERDDARADRDKALAQRNAATAANEELHARVEEAGRARIHAENETRTAKQQFAHAAAEVAQLVQERGERMKVEHALRDEVEQLRARVAELEKRDAWLSALEAAGVDNWSGMEHAITLRDEAEAQH